MRARAAIRHALAAACLLAGLALAAGPAAGAVHTTFEVKSTAPVTKNDYVAARKRAVQEAIRVAVESALKEILGDKFSAHDSAVSAILKKPETFVKSYRFMDSRDDLVLQVSEVTMEITLFTDALSRRLGGSGAPVEKIEAKNVLILVLETGIDAKEGKAFLDSQSQSEGVLVKSFAEAGLPALGRDALRGKATETMTLRAVKGDLSAVVEVAGRVGAGIVVIGNAVARETGAEAGQKTVETGLNLKALDVRKGRVVAAKSEIASQKRPKAADAEREAFQQAARKQAEFFSASVAAVLNTREPAPAASKPGAPASAEEF